MSADKATILVVDDLQANRAYLSTLLGAHGYNTIEADDGASALELLRTAQPDLVIVDIIMPRVDGYEFVRRTRAEAAISHTPIVLLTAHYREDQAKTLTDRFGVTRVLVKPIEPEVVLATVRQALEVREPARASLGPAALPSATPRSAAGESGAQHNPAFDEEHRRLLTDTLAQKAAQLEVTNNRLHGLIKLGRRLAVERDPRRLLSIFASAGGDLVGATNTLLAIGEVARSSSDDGRAHDVTIKHVLANGHDSSVLAEISSTRTAANLLHTFHHAKGPAFLSDDRGSFPEAIRQLPADVVLAPVATATQQYGFILFAGVPLHRDSHESIGSLAQSMGAVLGVAYENSIRYRQIEQHASRLQDEIIERRVVEDRLEQLNAELEHRVAERTEELEQSCDRLRQSERMASLGTLCAGLGHDMGNLLLPIRMRLDLIEQASAADAASQADGATVVEHVNSIRECIRYLGDLTNGLRLLSVDPEEEKSSAATTVLADWWEQVHPLMRSALPASIELEAALPDEQVHIAIARHRITQAVFNLVQNASDAIRSQHGDSTSATGQISIEARLVTDQVPTPSESAEQQAEPAQQPHVVITIRDNGPGMPEDVRRRAIEPFFTTKARGLSTGLGLSLVHGIVRAADGRLDIESKPSQGTTIILSLPIAAVATDQPRAARPSAVVSIVQPRLRALSVSMLDVLGYKVKELPLDGTSTADDELVAKLEGEAVWIIEAGVASAESIRRFLESNPDRRVALLGEHDGDSPPPGCLHLDARQSAAALRSQFNRHFRRRRAEELSLAE